MADLIKKSMDPVQLFLQRVFPKNRGFTRAEHGLSSGRTFVFVLNGNFEKSRAEILRDIANEDPGSELPEGSKITYQHNAPGSSAGRLEIDINGMVYKVYLKPNVKISNNFNAMLTELLPLAMLKANSNVLLSEEKGIVSISESVSKQIFSILKDQGKPKEKIDNLIDQLEQKIEYVRSKAEEIVKIYNFYQARIHKEWSGQVRGFRNYKWLGYDKVVKNDNYTDRADVQISNDCRISLKSVMPTQTEQKIFLCNTTFSAFMTDIDALTGNTNNPPSDTYGEWLKAYLTTILEKYTHKVLHYILGDYRKDLERHGEGYNHIVLSSNTLVTELGLKKSDSFLDAAMNKDIDPATLEVVNGKYRIVYGDNPDRDYVDIYFKDKKIEENDPSMPLKFKILEQIQ